MLLQISNVIGIFTPQKGLPPELATIHNTINNLRIFHSISLPVFLAFGYLIFLHQLFYHRLLLMIIQMIISER